jgi:hypothetical protein
MTRAGMLICWLPLVLGSCASLDLTQSDTVSSRDEAAGVTLYADATRWGQIGSSLQPSFSLSAASAVQDVLPITQQDQSETLNAVGTALGISSAFGPFKAPAGTGSTIQTRPATLPAATPPTGIPAGGTMPASSPSFTPGVDPNLTYDGAAALYEAVQLLNTDLSSQSSNS